MHIVAIVILFVGLIVLTLMGDREALHQLIGFLIMLAIAAVIFFGTLYLLIINS